MGMSQPSARGTLRLRGLLDRRFTVVLALLVALAAVGGWAAYTAHISPGEQTEEQVISTGSVSGSYDHGATVKEQNPAYAIDSRLSQRAIYPLEATPELDGAYVFSYSDTSASDASVEIEQTVTVRAVQEETVVWSNQLDSRTVTTENVDPGEQVTVPLSVDMNSVQQQISRIEESLGVLPGSTEVIVETNPVLSKTLNGEPQRIERTETLTVIPDRNVYKVTTDAAGVTETAQTERITTTRERGPLMSIGGPLGVVMAVLSILSLAWGRHTGKLTLTAREQAWLNYCDDRAEFDEWITRVELPSDTRDSTQARAASLQDLVDVSMDTDAPVVEDPLTGDFFVTDGTQMYRYSPPELADSSHDMADADTQNSTTDNRSGASGSGPIGDGGSKPSSIVAAHRGGTTELPPQPSFSGESGRSVAGSTSPPQNDAHTDNRRGDTEPGSSTEN